jgi:hypothetical protein
MKTIITTAHEEEYSNNSRTLGILLNLDMEGKRVDSLVYIYRKGMYIFFNTIMDMNDYLLYGDFGKTKRAYMSENEFDKYYDAKVIQGLFSENLTWQDKQ